MVADNLRPPSAVVALYQLHGIGSMSIFSSNHDVLESLPIMEISSLWPPTLPQTEWVQSNIQAYLPSVSFRYIAVGNEVIPGDLAQCVLSAMQNIHAALSSAGLHIKVSTAVASIVLGSSKSYYHPSAGAFSSESQKYMNPIVDFLANTGSPLLLNVYPYFRYKDEPRLASLSYASLTSKNVVVQDGAYGYRNLFHAIVDATYVAMEKVGVSNDPIVVTESVWPLCNLR